MIVVIVSQSLSHYRAAVFSALLRDAEYRYVFAADTASGDPTIAQWTINDPKRLWLTPCRLRMGLVTYQSRVVRLAMKRDVHCIIYEGNPYLVNTWISAALARLVSTFQYCNVLGNYLIGDTIVGIAAVNLVTKKSTKLLLAACRLTLEIGGSLSGSRSGTIGSLVILVLAVTLSNKWARNTLLLVWVSAVAVLMATVGVYSIQLTGSRDRATGTADILGRAQQFYLGGTLADAFRAGHGIGTGWGPYTMGISTYLERLKFSEVLPSSTIEGGYPYILAQTGIVGLLLFVNMHYSFAASSRQAARLRWFGRTIGVWSWFGNLPLCPQEVPVLAIAWWFLTGLYWCMLRQNERLEQRDDK